MNQQPFLGTFGGGETNCTHGKSNGMDHRMGPKGPKRSKMKSDSVLALFGSSLAISGFGRNFGLIWHFKDSVTSLEFRLH